MAGDEGWSLSDKAKADFEDMRALLDNITVTGAATMRKTKRSLAIFVHGQRAIPSQSQPNKTWLWIRISAATLVSGSRWKYTWAEVEKTAVGYDGWTLVDGGRTGPSVKFEYAYNTIEDVNVAARQIWGSGVDAANLSSGFVLVAAKNGDVFRAELVTPQVDGALPEAWFSFENSVDGTCT